MADPGNFDSKLLRTDGASTVDADNALLQKKKAEVDLQALDDRLRRAVLDGDVAYVQGRLGDRKLSEAEAVLLIRARQEHEEKVANEIVAQNTAASAAREDDAQEFLQTLFFTNQRQAAAAKATASAGTAAPVFDSYGQPYYANFGYDAQGNYNTSFGERIGTDGIMRDQNGGETDLRRGIYTRGNDFFSEQSGEALTRMDDGTYVLSRRVNGRNEILREGLSEQEAEQQRERMRREAAVLPEAEYQALLARQAEQDRNRPNPAASASAHNAEGGASQEDNTLRTAHGSASADSNRAPSGGQTAPIGASTGSVVGATARTGESVFSDVRAQMELRRQSALRAANDARVAAQSQSRDEDRTVGRSTRGSRTRGVGSAIAGGLTETNAGAQPGDGSYIGKLNSYHAADGSFMDYKGNFVDTDGNLWLANDKSGKPSFPRIEGVDYKELLDARAEGPAALRKWIDADPARAQAAKDVNAALQTVDNLRTQRDQATSYENWVFKSRGTAVDKYGNIWIGGELQCHGSAGGADYIDLLKKAEQGKMDEWKATGNLSKEEIEAIKQAIRTNEANLTAYGWDLSKDLKGITSTNSKFVVPGSGQAEQREETTQTATQKRSSKAFPVNP